MPAPDEPQLELVRVGGGRSRTARSWIAVGAIAVVSVAIVAAGFLGGSAPPPARPPSPPAAGRTDPSPRPEASQRGEVTATIRPGRVISPPNTGYEVDYARDGSHRPIVTQAGALAIFGFGERVPDGSYPGVITVTVGTPARGAPILFAGETRFVYGTTLEELAVSYFGGEDQIPAVRSAFGVDRGLGLLLDFDATEPGAPTRSVALLAHGNRAFVIESIGFDEMFPGLRNAASAGLVRFLAGFRFKAPLYVSKALGFQVVLPDGMESLRNDSGVIFSDRTSGGGSTRSIAVTAWRPETGTVLRLLTPFGDAQSDVVRARSAAEVEEAYLGSRPGAVTARTAVKVDGEDATRVRQEDEAETVFVVHGGRTYVISTGAVARDFRPEAFDAFLASLAFFEE